MSIVSFTKNSDVSYELELGRASGPIIIDLLLAAVDPTNPSEMEKLRIAVQSLVEETVKVRNLPDDDPAKDTDPGLPNYFWRGQGGNRDLVSRSIDVHLRHNPNGQEFDFGFSEPGEPFQFIDIDLSGI